MGLAKIAHTIYSVFWKIFKPQTIGVRAILIKKGKVLLVKHTYVNSWYLPGGGLKRGETFEEGIRRELNEELGVLVSDLQLHGVYNNFFEGKSDTIIVFISEILSEPNDGHIEIERFNFFDLNNLPEKTSPGTKRRIKEYREYNKPTFGLW